MSGSQNKLIRAREFTLKVSDFLLSNMFSSSSSSYFTHNSQVLAHYIIKPLNFPALVMFKLNCLTLAFYTLLLSFCSQQTYC